MTDLQERLAKAKVEAADTLEAENKRLQLTCDDLVELIEREGWEDPKGGRS